MNELVCFRESVSSQLKSAAHRLSWGDVRTRYIRMTYDTGFMALVEPDYDSMPKMVKTIDYDLCLVEYFPYITVNDESENEDFFIVVDGPCAGNFIAKDHVYPFGFGRDDRYFRGWPRPKPVYNMFVLPEDLFTL